MLSATFSSYPLYVWMAYHWRVLSYRFFISISAASYFKINSNKYLNKTSRATTNTTKNAVKISTAPVKLQVARRFGQRTWRSSYHAPLKYPPIENSVFINFDFGSEAIFLTAFGFLTVAFAFLTGLASVALMRVTFVAATACLGAGFFALLATLFSNIKSLLLQTVKYHYNPSWLLRQACYHI